MIVRDIKLVYDMKILLMLSFVFGMNLSNAQEFEVKLLDEAFKGFERRIGNGDDFDLSFSIPPGSIYESGVTNFTGISFTYKNEKLVRVAPIKRKVVPPSLKELYQFVENGVSLGDLMNTANLRELDSDQRYAILIGWSQAVIVLDVRNVNIELSREQIEILASDIGVPEVLSFLDMYKKIESGEVPDAKNQIINTLRNILKNQL